MSHPVESAALLLAGAKASVPLDRLPDLLARVQDHLAARREAYQRRYEVAVETEQRIACFVEPGHWSDLAADLGLREREADACRRAHAAQLLQDARRRDRRDEFEAALEVRQAVVIGR